MPIYRFGRDILLPYLRETGSDRKLRTQQSEATSSKYLIPFFGEMVVTYQTSRSNRIDGGIVRKYRQERKVLGKVCANSIKRELALASRACNYMISEHDFDMPNPFQGRLMSHRDKLEAQSKPKVWHVLTKAEESRLLLACEPLCRDIVTFALNTGFRLDEILGLTWNRLDDDLVRFTPDTQKSNRYGTRVLNVEAQAVIAKQIQQGPYVFHRDGERMQRWHLRTMWEKARDKAGLAGYKFHWLRKTAGQRILDEGGRLEDVQGQLGHSERKTTEEIYIKEPIDRIREAVGKIGRGERI